MAKEIAISKRLKISEAQQLMILAVLGASVILGAGISLIIHFTDYIAFNAKVISEADKSIQSYSDVIAKIGVCVAPKGKTYTEEELKNCDPNSIDIELLSSDTLRVSILQNLASNKALNSVQKDDSQDCLNPDTNINYTYNELNEIYDKATTSEEIVAASNLIKTCSALRVIPDALPEKKNEEALLASLNKIFNLSGWTPESISPNRSTSSEYGIEGLNSIGVSISVEADTSVTMTVLRNIEQSIRTFDIQTASIEWAGTDNLSINAQATAYYTDEATLTKTKKTIKPGGK